MLQTQTVVPDLLELLKKYQDGSVFMVEKSLTYFADADVQLQPKMYQDFDWETCKQKIIQEVLQL